MKLEYIVIYENSLGEFDIEHQRIKVKVTVSDIYKQTVLILPSLSDSAQGSRGSYFQAKALYLSLRTS